MQFLYILDNSAGPYVLQFMSDSSNMADTVSGPDGAGFDIDYTQYSDKDCTNELKR